VSEYLGVKKGESLLIVVDTATSPEIAEAVWRAALEQKAHPILVTIAVLAQSGHEPPPAVAAAMKESEVCLCAASRSLYHTEAKACAQAAGVRGLFNAPHRLDAWVAGAMTADFLAIRPLAESVARRLREGRIARVTSPAGTDLEMSIEGREPKGWLTGICLRPGEVSALPGGEVSLPPVEGTANGVAVIERAMTDLGRLRDPVVLTVRDGEAVEVAGGREADRLRALIDSIPNASNIAELGIGLNPYARLTGDVTEAKKRLGTAHVALGDNAAGYGGSVSSPLHLDGLILDATIMVDGEIVVDRGKVLV
jgi:leucyl aminopeptidase (aminopeptidase T)